MIEHRSGIPVIACVEDESGDLDIELPKLMQLYE